MSQLATLCFVAAALGGCATGGVTSNIFVDPSRYDLYDCKQLRDERVKVDVRVAQLEGLIAKAETGVAGALVSGLAYQSDYAAARAQRDLIDQKLAMNNCSAEPPPVVTTPAPPAKKKRKQQ
jgi:hypothetical protein